MPSLELILELCISHHYVLHGEALMDKALLMELSK